MLQWWHNALSCHRFWWRSHECQMIASSHTRYVWSVTVPRTITCFFSQTKRFYWLTSICPWIRAWEGRYLVSTFAVLGRYISNEFALERFDLQRDAEAQRCWLFRLTRVEPFRVFTRFFYFKVRVARTGQNIFFSTGQNHLSGRYPSATDSPWTCCSDVYIKKKRISCGKPCLSMLSH